MRAHLENGRPPGQFLHDHRPQGGGQPRPQLPKTSSRGDLDPAPAPGEDSWQHRRVNPMKPILLIAFLAVSSVVWGADTNPLPDAPEPQPASASANQWASYSAVPPFLTRGNQIRLGVLAIAFAGDGLSTVRAAEFCQEHHYIGEERGPIARFFPGMGRPLP